MVGHVAPHQNRVLLPGSPKQYDSYVLYIATLAQYVRQEFFPKYRQVCIRHELPAGVP